MRLQNETLLKFKAGVDPECMSHMRDFLILHYIDGVCTLFVRSLYALSSLLEVEEQCLYLIQTVIKITLKLYVLMKQIIF